ncbi:hypothetical protein [Pectobacterium polaris]|uniref:hypothetical protein n=1 Tax=Pectobacterium polaris TaxID=2042057 RepID=UPI000F8E065B|nr:hypothetical protein [Pectobacterium polaris]RUR99447.1 hypothetical protein KHDHEBDM_01730 [Pectobacterium polaris]
MELYKKSRMDTLYYNDEPAYTDELCSVSISNGIIEVSYMRGSERIRYIGPETSQGHFELTGNDGTNSKATLHRFPNGKVLVGKWRYDNYRGLWQITLSN